MAGQGVLLPIPWAPTSGSCSPLKVLWLDKPYLRRGATRVDPHQGNHALGAPLAYRVSTRNTVASPLGITFARSSTPSYSAPLAHPKFQIPDVATGVLAGTDNQQPLSGGTRLNDIETRSPFEFGILHAIGELQSLLGEPRVSENSRNYAMPAIRIVKDSGVIDSRP